MSRTEKQQERDRYLHAALLSLAGGGAAFLATRGAGKGVAKRDPEKVKQIAEMLKARGGSAAQEAGAKMKATDLKLPGGLPVVKPGEMEGVIVNATPDNVGKVGRHVPGLPGGYPVI